MRIRFLLILINLPLLIFARELERAAPQPICGTPHIWGKIPETVIIQSLAKPTAGDTTFYIRDDLYASSVKLIEVAFKKIKEESDIVIYAELAEYEAGRVTATDAEQLLKTLLYETPSGSINPNKGIYANETEIFGPIPDVDQNGKLFVLLIDVRDGYDPETSDTYVSGYFDPLDQIKQAGKGNYGDIIYIDTNPAKVEDPETQGVIAHELQHLIHYGADSDEQTWLNEGMSELAPAILGFSFISYSLFLRDTNRPLNSFDNTLTDYSKVSLWTFYCYRRFGVDFIRAVVREKTNSLDSYKKVLNDSGYSVAIEEVMQDWFLANLINDPTIAGGKYSYQGFDIPAIYSDYFHSNFTREQTISATVNNSAAQYICFYAGKNISYEMSFNIDPQFKLIVVKNYDPPVITFDEMTSSPFRLEDPNFGLTYSQLTLIPYWTRISATAISHSFSYSAAGAGGVEEIKITYAETPAEYIRLDQNVAAAKLIPPDNQYHLAGVVVNVSNDSPVIAKILPQLNQTPVASFEFIPNQQEWTNYLFPEPLTSLTGSAVYVSVESNDARQALGYAHTAQGDGRAYLKMGDRFQDLHDFQVDDEILTGDWLIGAIFHKSIITPPELSIVPDTLFFWKGESSKSFEVRNLGSEALDWEINSQIPDWMQIAPLAGENLLGLQLLNVQINRSLLSPNIYNHSVVVQSTAGTDSILISVLENNVHYPQAVIYPTNMIFAEKSVCKVLRVFNIGNGRADFSFFTTSPALVFIPDQGTINIDDTLAVNVYLDSENLSQAEIPFLFYNGIDTVELQFVYSGTISAIPEMSLKLFPVFPNPYVASSGELAKIRFRLIEDSKADLQIFNLLGEQVLQVSIDHPDSGLQVYRWNGKNQSGRRVSSGVYLLLLSQKGKLSRQKMVLLN